MGGDYGEGVSGGAREGGSGVGVPRDGGWRVKGRCQNCQKSVTTKKTCPNLP